MLCSQTGNFKKPFQLYTSFLRLSRLWIISTYSDCVGKTWWPVYIANTTQSCQVEGLTAVLLKIEIWVSWNVKSCQKHKQEPIYCSITLLTLQTVNSTPCKEHYPVRSVITQSRSNLPTVQRKLLLPPSRNPPRCILRQQVPLKCW